MIMTVVLIGVFSKNAFAVGGSVGGVLWLAVHVQWIERYKTAIRRGKRTNGAPPPLTIESINASVRDNFR